MKPAVNAAFSTLGKTSAITPAKKWAHRLGTAVGLVLLFSFNLATAAAPRPAINDIVLVHGALTDGSIWAPIITRLQAMGYHVTAVQNPLTSLADDVAATKNVLRHQNGNVLLVGHSWGGVVITEAGNAANVKGLVYLSAMAPDNGESMVDLLQRLKAPMQGPAPDADGFIWMDDPQMFHQFMAADVPMQKVHELISVQQPIAAASVAEKIQHAAWHEKPSWYLQATDDQAILPAVQQSIAQQIGAKSHSVRSSHMLLLSHPEAVAQFINQAAQEAAVHINIPN